MGKQNTTVSGVARGVQLIHVDADGLGQGPTPPLQQV